MNTDNRHAWNLQATRYFKQANLSIDFYINALSAAGFTLERFHQLRNRTPQPANEEEQLEQFYPRLMVFKCRK